MYVSLQPSCRSTCCDSGIATMAEYILLLGVSLAVFLSLFAAFGMAAATAGNDATTITAENVASSVAMAICETTGDGTASASASVDLTRDICGRPYMVYPCAGGRHVIVMVSRESQPQRFGSPLVLRGEGIHVAGFAVSGQGELRVVYDAGTRTVTIS